VRLDFAGRLHREGRIAAHEGTEQCAQSERQQRPSPQCRVVPAPRQARFHSPRRAFRIRANPSPIRRTMERRRALRVSHLPSSGPAETHHVGTSGARRKIAGAIAKTSRPRRAEREIIRPLRRGNHRSGTNTMQNGKVSTRTPGWRLHRRVEDRLSQRSAHFQVT